MAANEKKIYEGRCVCIENSNGNKNIKLDI